MTNRDAIKNSSRANKKVYKKLEKKSKKSYKNTKAFIKQAFE